jgi:predicted nucleotidyltransferase
MAKKRSEIKKIVAKYISELEKLGIDVSQVILFGSYAGGKPADHSDIDLAVVSGFFSKLDIFERQQILSRAHHNFSEPIEPMGFTPEQIKEKRGFAREIVETGLVVFQK